MEVEEVCADGDAEVLLAFALKSSVGEVGQGEAVCGIVGCGEPALVRGGRSLGHGGMIARSLRGKRSENNDPPCAIKLREGGLGVRVSSLVGQLTLG